MSIKTLKVYKTDKSKRGTNVTSEFKLFDDNVVNGRIRVTDSECELYWINVSDWVTVPMEVVEPTPEPTIIKHTVRWGENIEQIARQYDVDCGRLYAQYPNKLAAGMTITIVK
jgi:hypothetical protein